MKNLRVKKLLILYFIVTLFFIKIGVPSAVQNYEGLKQSTFVEQIVNLSHDNSRSQLLTVGIVTGEIVTGFTLAEVLITLLIIGVVASIVIPTLIAETQEQELKTAWKKAFAEINGAAKMQIANEGSVNVNTINNYMKVVQDCSKNQTLPACAMTCPSGWGCNAKPMASAIFITADGMQWGDIITDKWCVVDVNGLKGPNLPNKDVFVFCILSNGKIVPEDHPQCIFTHYSSNGLKWLSQ